MKFTNLFKIKISSLNSNSIINLVYYLYFILKKNNILNLKISKFTFPTKYKKFTILKSPHIHKTARTQLEIRTVKRILIINNCNFKQISQIKKIFNFFIKNLPISIKLVVQQQKVIFL